MHIAEKGGDQTDDPAYQKLDAGHAHPVHQRGEMVDHQDVQGKADGADQKQQVRGLQGKSGFDAQQIQPGDRDHHADPDVPPAFLFQEQPQDRYQDDIAGGQESGLPGRGAQVKAHLLERAAEKQHDSAAESAEEQLLFLRRSVGLFPGRSDPVQEGDDRQQRQPADQGADGVKRIGADGVAAGRLRDKSNAPDQGGEYQ